MISSLNIEELKKVCIDLGYNVINADRSKMMAYINSLYKNLTIKKLKLVALTLRVNTISRSSSEMSRDIIVVIRSTISRRLKSAFKKADIDINKVANSIDRDKDRSNNNQEDNKKIYFILNVL
jgi:L-lactate utilization protein LutC